VDVPVLQLGLEDAFIEHGDPARLLAMQGLDAAGIQASIVRSRFGARCWRRWRALHEHRRVSIGCLVRQALQILAESCARVFEGKPARFGLHGFLQSSVTHSSPCWWNFLPGEIVSILFRSTSNGSSFPDQKDRYRRRAGCRHCSCRACPGQPFAGAWHPASPSRWTPSMAAADVFSKAVKEMSGGKFEVSVHAAGELMPAFGVVDGVQNGTVEIAHTAPYYFFGKNPFAIGGAIPFGLNPPDHGLDGRMATVRKLMRELLCQYNIVNFLAATPARRWAAGSARKSSRLKTSRA
jgi:hypothetical protein